MVPTSFDLNIVGRHFPELRDFQLLLDEFENELQTRPPWNLLSVQQGKGGDGEGETHRGRPERSVDEHVSAFPNMTCQECQLCFSLQLLFSASTLPFTHICTHQGFFVFFKNYTLLNKQADIKNKSQNVLPAVFRLFMREKSYFGACLHSAQVDSLGTELFNWKAGPLTETCTVMPGKKKKGLWSRTFSNCISIQNSEAYIPIKRGEECTTCDTTRLK